MSQEREFDNAFKERLGNMDFEFKDAYWTEMSALMDGKKKKRGLLFWWISTGSVAAILLLVCLVYVTRNESQKQWTGFVNESAPKTNTEEQANTYNSTTSGNENTAENQMIDADLLSDSESMSTVQSDVSETSNPRHNSLNSNRQNNSTPMPSVPNTGNNAHFNATNTTPNMHLVMETVASSHPNSNDADENNTSSNGNIEDLSLNRMPLLAALPLRNIDSQLADFEQEDIKHPKTWYSHVGIVAGANFSRSFETQDGAVGGMGSHLGLRFYFSGRRGFQVTTGLSFGVNQINGLVYEEHRKIYGYNEYDLVNTIKYQSMLTANVPIYLGYEGHRFAVAGGFRLNYIMNTKGRVYTWDNSVMDQNIWGYAHGIKYFNMAVGFEATYHIARRWDVGVSLDLDLSSRSEENNDLISPEARLWQTGVFLKYRIN